MPAEKRGVPQQYCHETSHWAVGCCINLYVVRYVVRRVVSRHEVNLMLLGLNATHFFSALSAVTACQSSDTRTLRSLLVVLSQGPNSGLGVQQSGCTNCRNTKYNHYRLSSLESRLDSTRARQVHSSRSCSATAGLLVSSIKAVTAPLHSRTRRTTRSCGVVQTAGQYSAAVALQGAHPHTAQLALSAFASIHPHIHLSVQYAPASEPPHCLPFTT